MRTSAFTLIELLVVITIIAILMGLTLAIVPGLRFKARAFDTGQRLQQVTSGLMQYGSGEGSVCAALQRAYPLGGVADYATIKVILNQIAFDGGRGEASDNSPNAWPDNWSNQAKWDGTKGPWRRMRSNVFEALPTPAQHSATWYLATWPTRWPETNWDSEPPGSRPPILRHPWGRVGMRLDGTPCDPSRPAGTPVDGGVINSWATRGGSDPGALLTFTTSDASQISPAANPIQVMRTSGVGESIQTNQPPPFDLGGCSPLRSVALLQAAGILPADAIAGNLYRSDRSRSKRWNDAWGNPLVVTYCLFQPERHFRSWDQYDRRDALLKGAMEAYQYNRALYVAAAAPGPTLRTSDPLLPAWSGSLATWAAADDDRALRKLWRQIRDNTRAWEWTERSWSTPAWQGVRQGSGKERCFVTAPVEIK